MNNKKINQLKLEQTKHDSMGIIKTFLSSLIIPHNLPVELREHFKKWLVTVLLTGEGVIWKEGDKFHMGEGYRTDPLDDFGFGLHFTAFTPFPHGVGFDGVVNKDGVFIYPYSEPRKLSIFDRFTNIMVELDKSLFFLIKYTRLAPFLTVSDTKTKLALESVLKSIEEGNLIPILSDNILKTLVDGQTDNGINVLDIMKPEKLADLMTLDNIRELEKKHLFELFGMPYNVQVKSSAQETNAQTGTNGHSYLLPSIILDNFNDFADKLNELFNLNISFTLNPLILREMEKYFEQESENRATGENITDELDPVSVPDSKPTESEQGTPGDSNGNSGIDNKQGD